MKLCEPCGALCSDNAVACLACGEASWRRLMMPDGPEHTEQPNAAPVASGMAAIGNGAPNVFQARGKGRGGR